eukprot:738411-Pyramimonas_sp.AAC.1
MAGRVDGGCPGGGGCAKASCPHGQGATPHGQGAGAMYPVIADRQPKRGRVPRSVVARWKSN